MTKSISQIRQLLRTEIRQLAFQAFDIEPQRAALRKQQDRAAAGRLALVKLDADQVERLVGTAEIDVARLAGQHPVEPKPRDQATRLGLPRKRLFPVQPVDADHEPLLVLP